MGTWVLKVWTIAKPFKSPFFLLAHRVFVVFYSLWFLFSIKRANITGTTWGWQSGLFPVLKRLLAGWIPFKGFTLPSFTWRHTVTLSFTENTALCFLLCTESSDKSSFIWKVNPNTHLWQKRGLIPLADNLPGIRTWNRKIGSLVTEEVLEKHMWVEETVPRWLSIFNWMSGGCSAPSNLRDSVTLLQKESTDHEGTRAAY